MTGGISTDRNQYAPIKPLQCDSNGIRRNTDAGNRHAWLFSRQLNFSPVAFYYFSTKSLT